MTINGEIGEATGEQQMLKVIFVGKKDPAKTMDEYKKYYLEQHAPLVLRTVPQMRKYTINFPTVRPGKESPPFDFITEVWWDDAAAMHAFYKSDEYQNIIQPDEARLGGSGQGVHFEEFVQK
jgi:uncharacterized protein (TIGR02118 family)